jgi:hypothetical protein
MLGGMQDVVQLMLRAQWQWQHSAVSAGFIDVCHYHDYITVIKTSAIVVAAVGYALSGSR